MNTPRPEEDTSFSFAPSHRDRVLDAMAQCLERLGYEATTISDVAAEARMSKRTFYEQFPDKETCFLALYRLASASALRTLRDAVQPELPWQTQVESALQAYFQHLSAGPRLLRTLFAQPDAWRYVDCGEQTGGKLPGMGVHAGDLPAHS